MSMIKTGRGYRWLFENSEQNISGSLFSFKEAASPAEGTGKVDFVSQQYISDEEWAGHATITGIKRIRG